MIGTRKRIVLYFPRLTDPATDVVVSAHHLPVALLAIAGWPAREGYEVVIVDANLYSPAEAHRRVVEACEGALLFGTTGILGYQVRDAAEIGARVRAQHPKLPRIVGGWFASCAPELYLADGLFDAVCLGQGEITFRDIVAALFAREPLEAVPGLALWRDGALLRTEVRHPSGYDEIAETPWHLLDFEPYRERQLNPPAGKSLAWRTPPPPGLDRPHVTLGYFSSYGCPEDCAFCCSPGVSAQRWKAMPAERMVDDLYELHDRWGFDVVQFYDANWSVAERRALGFAQELLERGPRFSYLAYFQTSHVVRYAEETLDKLAQSGLYAVLIGAESGSEETTGRMGKLIRGEDNIAAAEALDRRGISACASYMVGLPGEQEDSMLATLDQCRRMAVACPKAAPMVWPYHPIPGSELFSQAVEEGFVPPSDLAGWGKFLDYRLETTWPGKIPPEVSRLRGLYNHFATLASGTARARAGFWQRRAQRRLADDEGFRRGWRLGGLEAWSFHHFGGGRR